MTKTIIVKKIMTDKEISQKEGEYFDENFYNKYVGIVNENIDVITDEGKILLKFRKQCIKDSECKKAVEAFRDASKKKHENRGASAGMLNRNKMANYIGEFVNPGKFRTRFKSSKTGILSNQATSNLSPSNIVGYFDKPDRNLKGKGAPCRLTAYNRDHPKLWEKALPFLNTCNAMFKKLAPIEHELQRAKCQETRDFAISDTAFSTATINYSWRTALHRDAGDFRQGFGNLIVLEDHTNPNYYKGCYLGFPQYGVAVNARQGDFLAMNVHEWHCNTEFIPLTDEVVGRWHNRDKVNRWYYNRIAVVCYLREKIINLKEDIEIISKKKRKFFSR